MKSDAIVNAVLLCASLWLSVALASAQERHALVSSGENAFKSQGCDGCHQVGKFGTPSLAEVTR